MSTDSDGKLPIRVLIVDDHALFRQGVSSVLNQSPGIEVVGEAENGQMAVELYSDLRPNVVMMDINMPVMNGIEATRKIKRLDPNAKILILTVSDEALFRGVKAGASGYVLKTAAPDVVIDSLRLVSTGEPVIPAELASEIIHDMSKPKEPTLTMEEMESFTDREVDVLRQLSTGASNRDIANALLISENTVRNHVCKVLNKLHVSSRGQAAAYAMRRGLTIEFPDDDDD